MGYIPYLDVKYEPILNLEYQTTDSQNLTLLRAV